MLRVKTRPYELGMDGIRDATFSDVRMSQGRIVTAVWVKCRVFSSWAAGSVRHQQFTLTLRCYL